MTQREGIYDIINRLTEFDDDSDFSEKYIAELMDQSRAKFIERDYLRKKIIPIDVRQSITYPLETVDTSMDVNILETGKYLVRTAIKLPKLLVMNRLPGIYSITSIDRNIGEYDLMDKHRARYAADAPFCPLAIYLDTDDRLYLVSSRKSIRNLQNISLDHVLENPSEAIGYSYADARDGEITELEDYPVSKKMWGYIKDDVVSKLLGSKFTPADISPQAAEMPGNPMSDSYSKEYLSSVRQNL